MDAPTGTVTFLFTDVEGSTRLLERLGDRYDAVLYEHREIIRDAAKTYHGYEFSAEGDGLGVAFTGAADALAAALHAQIALDEARWPDGERVKVRMGLHTGDVAFASTGYVGLAVHEAARVRDAAHGGQILLTATTASLVGDAVAGGAVLRELGRHRLKDFDAPRALLQVCHPQLVADFPPPRTPAAGTHNLPSVLTSFVGRDRERTGLRELLERQRLVTITGPGGCGKTRLSVEVANATLGRYPDGVRFVDLVPVTDPADLATATASAVGAPAIPGRAAEDQITAHLGDRRLLVVLDNCEHVVASASALVSRITRDCPDVTVLATSREPLRAPGEHVWPLVPLPLDDAERLFLDRSTAARPETAVQTTAVQATAVAEICRHLDGLPLAVELAAARTAHLSPAEIADRLNDRFRLLRATAADVAHHRTLEAAIDWSYELLGEPERVTLRRLSVFAGPCTLAAAESVCGGDGVESDDVFDHLASLIDKSLVVADSSGPVTRYSLLETVREYASARLAEDARELDATTERHCRWFTAVAAGSESSFAAVMLPDFVDDATRHALPHGMIVAPDPAFIEGADLEAALAWALDRDVRSAVWLFGSLRLRWTNFEGLQRALAVGDRLLARAHELHVEEWLTLTVALANLRAFAGQFADCFDMCGSVLDNPASASVPGLRAAALVAQGVAAQSTRKGVPDELLRRAIELAEAEHHPIAAAVARIQLGDYLVVLGRTDEATRLLDAGLAEPQLPLADRANALVSRTVCALVAGEVDQALASVTDAQRLSAGMLSNDVFLHAFLALALAAAGEPQGAADALREAIALQRRQRIPLLDADTLVIAGAVHHLNGDHGKGARLLGAARAAFEPYQSWRAPYGGALYVHFGGRVRAALDPEEYERERATGKAMTVDDAFADATAP